MAVETQENAQTSQHVTQVNPSARVGERHGRNWRARCTSCSWVGPERRSMLSAVLDGGEHEGDRGDRSAS